MTTKFNIDITNTLSKFSEFFEHSERMILSAKFGDGKTYLLNEFMELNNSKRPKYYFVVLHPVNYVVEENRDIFEYIKRDILFQMLQDEKVFDLNDNFETLVKTIEENVSFGEIYDFLLSVQPFTTVKVVGKILKSGAEKYLKISKSYSDIQNKPYNYVNSFAVKKGSLAECDGFTQLIQSTLSLIEEQYTRKTVLVIEDMDRLDPGHLFRILNVLGAQIDNPYFTDGKDKKENNEKSPNKFGFSKILLVMDYSTSEHIFHHFYGDDADYEGYMQKFLDVNPFVFSLRTEAQRMLRNKIKETCLVDEDFFVTSLKHCVINDKIPKIMDFINNLSVRRCKQIILEDIDEYICKDEDSSKFIRTLRIIAYIKLMAPSGIKLWQIYNSFTENIVSNIDIMFPVIRDAMKSSIVDYTIKVGNKKVIYDYDEVTQKSKEHEATTYITSPLDTKSLQSLWVKQEPSVLHYIDFE